jgi:hypothetical protein
MARGTTTAAFITLICAIFISRVALGQDDEPDINSDLPPIEDPEDAKTPAKPTPKKAPAAAAAPAPAPAPAPTPAQPPAKRPYARANRLAMSISFGFGSASLSRYHEGVDVVEAAIRQQNPGVTLDGELKSNFQINGAISFRYYFPYYLLAEVGYSTLYNWVSANAMVGAFGQSIESHNLVMEVPILVGGYYTFIDRLYVHGAVGPSIFFFGKALWDPGTDFETDSGVGMQAAAGADFLVAEHLGLGLELRYRYLKTGDLMVKDTNVVFKSGTESYYLDFSGISLMVHLRFFVL